MLCTSIEFFTILDLCIFLPKSIYRARLSPLNHMEPLGGDGVAVVKGFVGLAGQWLLSAYAIVVNRFGDTRKGLVNYCLCNRKVVYSYVCELNYDIVYFCGVQHR
jgi:hypothetical protein